MRIGPHILSWRRKNHQARIRETKDKNQQAYPTQDYRRLPGWSDPEAGSRGCIGEKSRSNLPGISINYFAPSGNVPLYLATWPSCAASETEIVRANTASTLNRLSFRDFIGSLRLAGTSHRGWPQLLLRSYRQVNQATPLNGDSRCQLT